MAASNSLSASWICLWCSNPLLIAGSLFAPNPQITSGNGVSKCSAVIGSSVQCKLTLAMRPPGSPYAGLSSVSWNDLGLTALTTKKVISARHIPDIPPTKKCKTGCTPDAAPRSRGRVRHWHKD
jgi:hypothetical protein